MGNEKTYNVKLTSDEISLLRQALRVTLSGYEAFLEKIDVKVRDQVSNLINKLWGDDLDDEAF